MSRTGQNCPWVAVAGSAIDDLHMIFETNARRIGRMLDVVYRTSGCNFHGSVLVGTRVVILSVSYEQGTECDPL